MGSFKEEDPAWSYVVDGSRGLIRSCLFIEHGIEGFRRSTPGKEAVLDLPRTGVGRQLRPSQRQHSTQSLVLLFLVGPSVVAINGFRTSDRRKDPVRGDRAKLVLMVFTQLE